MESKESKSHEFDWEVGASELRDRKYERGEYRRVPVIMVSGYARAGKDTAADYFADHGYHKIGFSDPLYEMLAPFLGLTVMQLHKLKERQAKMLAIGERILPQFDVRYLLKTLGTEWGRDCVGSHIWAEFAYRKWLIMNRRGQLDYFVFRDWRFESEYDYFAAKIGRQHIFRVKITRDDCQSQVGHRSEDEIALLPCDWLVENNATVAELYTKLGQGFQLFQRGLV